MAFTEREPEIRRLSLSLNSSLEISSEPCCSGPGLDAVDGPGSDGGFAHVDGPGPDGGSGLVDGPGSDGGSAHVDGPGLDGGSGLVDGPGSDGGYAHVDGPGSDEEYGLLNGGAGGGWSSVGPRLDRGRFESTFKLSCGGGRLELCDGDGL